MAAFVATQVSFARLAAATKDWSELVGRGSTGEVFHGELDDVPVAVKRLRVPPGAGPEAREDLGRRFEAELRVLSVYRHARLVRLLAWAAETSGASAGAGAGVGAAAGAGGQYPFAIAFELLEGGSLADWLEGPNGEPAPREQARLSALERVDVALGAAAGLAFLHGFREEADGDATGVAGASNAAAGAGGAAGASNAAAGAGGAAASAGVAPDAPVLHRDVKSANIGISLVGGSPYAKLLDCGLAKALRGGAGAAAAAVGASFTGGLAAGTAGYMAPEVTEGTYTVLSEVFAFGVVLLELITGRRASAGLAREVRDACEDDADSRDPLRSLLLRAEAGVWPEPALALLAQLVVECIHTRPKRRPASMEAVLARLRALRSAVDSDAPPLVACAVCLEEVAPATLVRCGAPDGAHSLCRGCLQGHVAECAAQGGAALARTEGAIPCVEKGCAARWSLRDIGEVLDKGTLLAYNRAVVHAAFDAPREKRLHDERMAAAAAAALARRAALAERVRELRLVVVERDLLLRCPRCAAAFDAYDGCNALTCGSCGCGFCALCLTDCGNDSHNHYHTVHGGVIFDKPRFEAAARERRRAALVAVLQGLAGEGAPRQRALAAELAKADLGPLGLRADELLREAGVAAADVAPAGGANAAGAAAAPAEWACPMCGTLTAPQRSICAACATPQPGAPLASVLSDGLAAVLAQRGDDQPGAGEGPAQGGGGAPLEWLVRGLEPIVAAAAANDPFAAGTARGAARWLLLDADERDGNDGGASGHCASLAAEAVASGGKSADELVAAGGASAAARLLSSVHGDARAAEMCCLLMALLAARSAAARAELAASRPFVALACTAASVHRASGSAAALFAALVVALAEGAPAARCRTLAEAGCATTLFYLADARGPDAAFDVLLCEALAALASPRPVDATTCDAVVAASGARAVVAAMNRRPLNGRVAASACSALASIAAGATSPVAVLGAEGVCEAVLAALASFAPRSTAVRAALSALESLAGRSAEGAAAVRCAGGEQGVAALLRAPAGVGPDGAAVKAAAERTLLTILRRR